MSAVHHQVSEPQLPISDALERQVGRLPGLPEPSTFQPETCAFCRVIPDSEAMSVALDDALAVTNPLFVSTLASTGLSAAQLFPVNSDNAGREPERLFPLDDTVVIETKQIAHLRDNPLEGRGVVTNIGLKPTLVVPEYHIEGTVEDSSYVCY